MTSVSQFNGKYRVDSARLSGWDYASAGWYYITLCTKDKQCFVGDITDRQMTTSPVGAIVAEEWQRTAQVRLNVELDEWILMPNHLHGIVIIARSSGETPHRGVSTATPRLQANSVGAVIGQFKSVCTKRIWAAGYRTFSWQTRYYDHIIRDDKSLAAIRKYIADNPAKWELDKENPAGLHM